MSTKAQPSLIAHGLLAFSISYGLSVFFWLALHVFNLTGFILVSALAAIFGMAIGWLSGKRLWITALASLIGRLGLYVFMTRGL